MGAGQPLKIVFKIPPKIHLIQIELQNSSGKRKIFNKHVVRNSSILLFQYFYSLYTLQCDFDIFSMLHISQCDFDFFFYVTHITHIFPLGCQVGPP